MTAPDDIVQAVAQGKTEQLRDWIAQGGDANLRGADGMPLWVTAIVCDAIDKEIGRIRPLMQGGLIDTDAVFPYEGYADSDIRDVLEDVGAMVDDPLWIEAVEDMVYPHRERTRQLKDAARARLKPAPKGLKL